MDDALELVNATTANAKLRVLILVVVDNGLVPDYVLVIDELKSMS